MPKELAIALAAALGVTVGVIVTRERNEAAQETTVGHNTPVTHMPNTCAVHHGKMVCDDCDAHGNASFASMAIC